MTYYQSFMIISEAMNFDMKCRTRGLIPQDANLR